MAKRAPWYKHCRWEVFAKTKSGQWKPIYCATTKSKAQADAAAWTAEMGDKTRVLPGAGHQLYRNNMAHPVRVPKRLQGSRSRRR